MQMFNLLFDTGSDLFWVPAANCTHCPKHVKKYNWTNSEYDRPLNQRYEIKYGKGATQGFLVEDLITFQDVKAVGKLMLADS